ncbi:MAG: hypothetical protein LBV75_02960 [Paludibacter sp.]|jgi:hypothetical protein|nr:hypothetical protein [Paludibacter sp.]
MIHTVNIDDRTVSGRRFVRDYGRARKGITFVNPAISSVVPEGYLTHDDFWKQGREIINEVCKKNGVL